MENWFFRNLERAVDSVRMASTVEIVTPEFAAVHHRSTWTSHAETRIVGEGEPVWMFKTSRHAFVVAQLGDYLPDDNGEFHHGGAEGLPLGFQWAVVPLASIAHVWESFDDNAFIKLSRPSTALVLVGMPRVVKARVTRKGEKIKWTEVEAELDPRSEFLQFP